MIRDPLPHQTKAAGQLAALVKSKGCAYLAGQVRSGKTATAILAASLLPVRRVAFITKKNAIQGILDELAVTPHTAMFLVTNYEQAHKLNPADYDLIILDEAHNISTVGKPSARFKTLRQLCWDKPVIWLSGTPLTETLGAAFYQFGVTKYTPLRYKDFYEFFREWGTPSLIKIQQRYVETYKKYKPGLEELIEPYIVRITQTDAGIVAKAEDVVHYFDLNQDTLDLINELKADGVSGRYALDSDSAVRAAVHQIEAGAFLYDNKIVTLPGTEMMDRVRELFGDSPDVAVMCHYRSTRAKVAEHLPHVHVYSSEAHAEGVKLGHYKHFVILNFGFSGAKHVQRRDRATLIGQDEGRQVHFMLARGQLSDHAYRMVSRKRDFNLKLFRETCLKAPSKNPFLTG